MRGNRKKSYKKNINKKKTQCKKGHVVTYITLNKDLPENTSHDEAKLVFHNQSLVRLDHNEYLDMLQTSASTNMTETTDPNIIPCKLRPAKRKTTDIITHYVLSKKVATSMPEENCVVNINKLSELIRVFLPHKCKNALPVVTVHKRQGLCNTVCVQCNNCKFKSNMVELFTKVKKRRGPPAGILNDALLIPVLKSKMGISDIQLFLSCLNIMSPNKRVMQRKLNHLCDMVTDLNEQQMLANQEYVKRINQAAGVENIVHVETDTSYNSRPQSGCEALSILNPHFLSKQLS